jgi:hypothetical protein
MRQRGTKFGHGDEDAERMSERTVCFVRLGQVRIDLSTETVGLAIAA